MNTSKPDGIFPPCPPATSHRNPQYPACGGDWALAPYLKLFTTLSVALKKVDAKIPVGGPATQQLGWVEEIRKYTLKNNVAIDFISTHQVLLLHVAAHVAAPAARTDVSSKQYPGDHQVPQNLEGHSEAIAAAAAQIGSDERKLPMYLTEYAINNHDSVGAAAGVLSYVARLSGVLPLYSYWVRQCCSRISAVNSLRDLCCSSLS